VDEALRSKLSRWFSTIEADEGPVPAAVVDCLRELTHMLDVRHPTRLDSHRSAIRCSAIRYEAPGWATVLLAHDTDKDADVFIEIGGEQAIVFWLSTHEHIDAADGYEGRPWTTVVVDFVALVMSGEYQVEHHYRGARLVKSRLVDVGEPDDRRGNVQQSRVLSTTGYFRWRPWPAKRRVEWKRVDYGLEDPPS
jgi:hypothetical protein